MLHMVRIEADPVISGNNQGLCPTIGLCYIRANYAMQIAAHYDIAHYGHITVMFLYPEHYYCSTGLRKLLIDLWPTFIIIANEAERADTRFIR